MTVNKVVGFCVNRMFIVVEWIVVTVTMYEMFFVCVINLSVDIIL